MNVYALSVAGVNVAEGIRRFSGHAEIYEKYVKRFAEDPNYRLLCEAVAGQNVKAAFAAAHALKGVAGNLSMDRLYNDLYPLVEELRGGSLEHAEDLLAQVACDYQAVVSALETACA